MNEDIKKQIEKMFSSLRVEDQIKDWLRHHYKYGASCPYCGLPSKWPGKAHKECLKQI